MFNWRELPFVRLLVPLIAGILLSYLLQFNHPLLIGLVVLWPLLLWAASKFRGLYKHRWLFGAFMYLLVFQLGYQSGYFQDERNWDGYIGQQIGGEGYLSAIVRVKDSPMQKKNSVRVEAEVIRLGESPDSLFQKRGNLLLYIARDSFSGSIEYGDELLIGARLKEVNPPHNPHSFDYRRYLHFKNIHHQAFVRSGEWKVIGKNGGNPILAQAIQWQEHFLATLSKHLQTPNELAVGSALILGYRNEIPEEIQTAYAQTGAMHVLAVSGLHVGIVFILLNFFLKRIRLNLLWWRLTKAFLVLTTIWTFALVTGASPSVVRAAMMFSCLQLGLTLQRDANIYNTLAISAFAMLVWNPFLLASVSFQLSYLAVFGIVFFQQRFAKLIYVKHPFLKNIWQLICVSLAAQLMLVPLTFLYFHQFPTYFWLTSLLLVPLAGFELGTGILLLLLENIWPWAAGLAGKILWWMLKVGNEFVTLVQGFPGAVVDGIWLGGTMVALLYFVLTSSMMAIASRKFRWAIYSLAFMVVVSGGLAFASWARQLDKQLVVYDVYKHTAIDVFDERKLVSIVSDGIETKALEFASEGHRFAMGVKKVHSIPLTSEGSYVQGNIYFDSQFLQFGKVRMAIVTTSIDFPTEKKIELDYVLVSGSPRLRMEDIQNVYRFKKIIFDASNKKWQVQKWKNNCEELGLEYFDVTENGAFVLDL